MEEIADEKIAEIQSKIQEKHAAEYSQEEIRRMMDLSAEIANKSVLSMLCCVLAEGPRAKKSVKVINAIKSKITKLGCLPFSLTFAADDTRLPPEIKQLNVCMSVCARDYATQIDIPDGYEKDLCENYMRIKEITVAYWKQFTQDNPILYDKICKLRPDVDFSALVVDPTNKTTLYFDEKSTSRVGILCYYVGHDGKILYKKTESRRV